jgi:hypothetical protein
MAARDPKARKANARIAANVSWARTPVRSERTEIARRSSPGSIDYWLDRIDPDGEMSTEDRRKAARNALRAYMGQLSQRRTKKKAAGDKDQSV